MATAAASNNLTDEDSMCISSLFDEAPDVVATATPTQGKSGDRAANAYHAPVETVSVEDKRLAYRFSQAEQVDTDEFKRLVQLFETSGAEQVVPALAESFEKSPRAVRSAGAHMVSANADPSVLQRALGRAVPEDGSFGHAPFCFIESAFKELVRASRFSAFEQVGLRLCSLLLDSTISCATKLRRIRSETRDGVRAEEDVDLMRCLKNLMDLFSMILVTHQHSPDILYSLQDRLAAFISSTFSLSTEDWKSVAMADVERPRWMEEEVHANMPSASAANPEPPANRPTNVMLMAHINQITSMGFSETLARHALKQSGGTAEKAVNFALAMTDAEKEKIEGGNASSELGHENNVNKGAEETKMPDSGPDDGADEKSISTETSNSEDAAAATAAATATADDTPPPGPQWCFEFAMLSLMKSLLTMFRGHYQNLFPLANTMKPFYSILQCIGKDKSAPFTFAPSSTEKGMLTWWAQPDNESNTAPPWFEGLLVSGVGEHSPGPELAMKAQKRLGGHAVTGAVFAIENQARSAVTGYTHRGGEGEGSIFHGTVTNAENASAPLALTLPPQERIDDNVHGWHASLKSFRGVYGKLQRVNARSCIDSFDAASVAPNLCYVNKPDQLLFIPDSPLHSSSGSSNFALGTCIKVPRELFHAAEEFEQAEKTDENDPPDLFCAIFALENCGIALTPEMKLVAWRVHQAPTTDAPEETAEAVVAPAPPVAAIPTIELTEDLKMMVDSGIVTKEQAYEMMGVDVTPRSTSPAAPATDEGATEKEKNEQQRVISFIVSLQPIEENTLLKIALVFDGKELCLLVNDEVVGIEEAEGPDGAPSQVCTTPGTLPATSLTLGGIPMSNPYFDWASSNMEPRYFTGTLCNASLLIDHAIVSYWPLNAASQGADFGTGNLHLSLWKRGALDFRHLPDFGQPGTSPYFQLLEEKPDMLLDCFHTEISGTCQLSGCAELRGDKVFMEGSSAGALWFSNRHEVTGGFDFSCICSSHDCDEDDTESVLEYSLVLRNSSVWVLQPTEGALKENRTMDTGCSVNHDVYWEDYSAVCTLESQVNGEASAATGALPASVPPKQDVAVLKKPMVTVDVPPASSDKVEHSDPLVRKAIQLLRSGADQRAVLKAMKADGMELNKIVPAIQKALSFQGSNAPIGVSPSPMAQEDTAVAAADTSAAGAADLETNGLSRSSLYLRVQAAGNEASLSLEFEKEGCTERVICCSRRVSREGAERPTLRYRLQRHDGTTRTQIIVSFGKYDVLEANFDILKEMFGSKNGLSLGLWAGLLHGKGRRLEVSNVAFRGRSIATTLPVATAVQVPPAASVPSARTGEPGSQITKKDIDENPDANGDIFITWETARSTTSVVQPIKTDVYVEIENLTKSGPLHKDAWIGMYDVEKIGSKNTDYLEYVSVKNCKEKNQHGTFKVERSTWIEFRLFPDCSNKGAIAKSGVYRFAEKAPRPLLDSELQKQAMLAGSQEIASRDDSCTSAADNTKHETSSSYLEKLITFHTRSLPDSAKEETNEFHGIWDTTIGQVTLCVDHRTALGFQVEGVFQASRHSDPTAGDPKLPGNVEGIVTVSDNTNGKNWKFNGTWVPIGHIAPAVCHWNFNGPATKAVGKWFRDDVSGRWTLRKARFEEYFRTDRHYSGLINMSADLVNVCYQNSVMQCLYHSDLIRDFMFRLNDPSTRSGEEEDGGAEEGKLPDTSAEEDQPALRRFNTAEMTSASNLLHGLKKLYGALTFSQRSAQASHVLQKEIIQRFEKGKQQDAHDFLVYLIDNLSTALDKEAALKGSANPGCANFIQDNFEGKSGFIMKRRDTGETWVTNQDVFVNLNVSLPQRYAPITKIVVLSEEGGDGVHSTGGHETGFELLKVPLSNGKKGENSKKVFFGIYRGEEYGLPITKLRILTFKFDEGIVIPEGFTILMTNLNPSTKDDSDRIYLAYQQSLNSLPIVEMALVSGGKKAKIGQNFTKVDKPLNGPNGFEGNYVYMSFKKDQSAVRDLMVSHNAPKDYSKLPINILSIGDVSAAIDEAKIASKSKTNNVVFAEKSVTFLDGPERLTNSNLGIYIGGLERAKKREYFEHLRIVAILDLSNNEETSAEFFGKHVEAYCKLDVSTGEKFSKNIDACLKFFGTCMTKKQSIMLVCKDGVCDSVAVFLAYYVRGKAWSLKKSYACLKRMRHTSTESRISYELFQCLAKMEILKLGKSSLNEEEWKSESGRGQRITDGVKFPALLSSNVTASTAATAEDKVTSPEDASVEKPKSRAEEQYVHVSYGGQKPVVTDIALVDMVDSKCNDTTEVCCKLPNGKYVALKRGNGCPVTNVQLFRAPEDVPRFQDFEVIDLIAHDPTLSEEVPLEGIWKPKSDDKMKQIFCFKGSPIFEHKRSKQVVVHGVISGGVYVRGLLTDCSTFTEDEKGTTVSEGWMLDGMTVQDTGVQPLRVSFRDGEYSWQEVGTTLKCKKSTLATSVGMPLTGVLLVESAAAVPEGYTLLDKTIGDADANFGSTMQPLYFALRHGGDFDPISELSISYNGIELAPPGAITIDGNLNKTMAGAEVVLSYRLCPPGSSDAIMSMGLSKLGENVTKSGMKQIRVTESLGMDANLNQNAAFPDFYVCFKKGSIPAKKTTMEHAVNGTYSIVDDKGRDKTASLFALCETECLPIYAEYNLQNPENYVSTAEGFMFKEAPEDAAWQVQVKFEAKRLKGVARFEVDAKLQTCTGVWGAKKLELIKDSYLKLGYQRDYNSDWANGVEVFSGRCRGNRIEDMVAQDVSVLGGRNAWQDDTGKKVEVTRTSMVVNAPRHLIVSIQRSKWDVEQAKLVKDSRDINIEPLLKLPGGNGTSLFQSEEQSPVRSRRYGLYGIVVHSGTTANSGHYYAYARHSHVPDLDQCESATSPWMLFNDDRISVVSYDKMTQAIRSKKNDNVYLMFYKELNESSDSLDQSASLGAWPDWVQHAVEENRQDLAGFFDAFQSPFYDDFLRDDVLLRVDCEAQRMAEKKVTTGMAQVVTFAASAEGAGGSVVTTGTTAATAERTEYVTAPLPTDKPRPKSA